MEQKDFYQLLVQRYLNKQLTDKELELFVELVKENKLDDYLLVAMNQEAGITEADELDYETANKVRPIWYKIPVAAAILFILSFGLYFYLEKNQDAARQVKQELSKTNDIEPGGNKATLTLANGSTISITDANIGKLAEQAGVKITKSTSGKLVYEVLPSSAKNKTGVKYNTISTPRGGDFQINLPDGTKVWLNAASSIKFTTDFANVNSRRLELRGEAYFEVAKKFKFINGKRTQQRVPFVVVTDKQEIEVLGTHFNVNSYDDELDTKTTLLEGSVKVSLLTGKHAKAGISRLLKPGEQSIVTHAATDVQISKANLDQVMAWQKGYFHFENDDLQSVMRQLSRWYDVEVVYQVKRPDDEFMGDIPRSVKLSEVLKMLEFGGVNFKIEGRKLIVIK
ncbi:FecR family protein [Pedobacter frigoris]|uniref:FecR family protein n=1 Tax=Pedobacter frigoris TaxID=2571272 RepID=UPI00292D57DE|nr:FecR domain-containing protein [Pedobacter frigoris]